VKPPFGGRGDLGGCWYLDEPGEVIELVHMSFVGRDDLECGIKNIMFGGLEGGA
jgi:hypothetical protein